MRSTSAFALALAWLGCAALVACGGGDGDGNGKAEAEVTGGEVIEGDAAADGTCTPDCAGRQCGPNGCGGSCGDCPGGELCDQSGQCVAGTECGLCYTGLECGADPDAGSFCSKAGCGEVDEVGRCEGSMVLFCDGETLFSIDCAFLSNGHNACAFDQQNQYYDCLCQPSCAGKVCGDDLCGGTCGTCGAGTVCVDGGCAPCSCDGKVCGDDGCGSSCGQCGEGQACAPDGQCVQATECGVCHAGLSCGAAQEHPLWCTAEGCGDVDDVGQCLGEIVVFCDGGTLSSIDCGFTSDGSSTCGYDPEYAFYDCLCKPVCDGRTCGDDGCGGSCGECGQGSYCDFGQCQACGCSGKQCGDDGCGGSCGTCSDGEFCNWEGQCLAAEISACCEVSPSPGCAADPAVEACVCQDDEYCCQSEWDSVCVTAIQELKCAVCCVPDCRDKLCGDDGCGGQCGECGQEQFCRGGWCYDCGCDGKVCGDDGCGTSCGTCEPGEACVQGACEVPTLSACCDALEEPGCPAEPAVEACVCQDDEYCCSSAWDDWCVAEVDALGCGTCCLPDCKDKACGDDGCGGSCGECDLGLGCGDQGQCVVCECLPGQECGADTCGQAACGSCPEGQYCDPDNQCITCGCGGLECGPGPCGESCGECDAGYCEWGTCVPFSGGCCEAKGSGGCEDEAVAQCVCAQDAFCCEVAWDMSCVAKVESLACGECP
jgi:hypothetical protein